MLTVYPATMWIVSSANKVVGIYTSRKRALNAVKRHCTYANKNEKDFQIKVVLVNNDFY